MKFDTEGTYTLTYTATDSCGNSTSEERTVVVASPRTVLYTDGTFIINEDPSDKVSNEALHGAATNIYIPFDPNGSTDVKKYMFTKPKNRPWHNEISLIKSAIVGTPISPTSMQNWFYDMSNLTNCDLSNLNTSNVTTMRFAFYNCRKLASLDVSGFDTSNVLSFEGSFASCMSLTTLDVSGFDTKNVGDMSAMFNACTSLVSIDVTNFDTSNVGDMLNMFASCSELTVLDLSNFNTIACHNTNNMFGLCTKLETIYATSTFDTTNVSNSTGMFNGCSLLKGGAGTTWDGAHIDKEYARIDNPPDAPGYFTLKPSA